MAYSIDASSDSCYPGTSVLVNKLGIEDQAQLDENEALIVGVNCLHPFREGNGRTQRLYFRQLVQRAGYKLDFPAVDSDRMIIATIQATSGVDTALRELFDEIVIPQKGLVSKMADAKSRKPTLLRHFFSVPLGYAQKKGQSYFISGSTGCFRPKS